MQIVNYISNKKLNYKKKTKFFSLKRQEKHLHQYLLAELGTK